MPISNYSERCSEWQQIKLKPILSSFQSNLKIRYAANKHHQNDDDIDTGGCDRYRWMRCWRMRESSRSTPERRLATKSMKAPKASKAQKSSKASKSSTVEKCPLITQGSDSCEGSCGGSGGGGTGGDCWCTPNCVVENDCCTDAEFFCGVCEFGDGDFCGVCVDDDDSF